MYGLTYPDRVAYNAIGRAPPPFRGSRLKKNVIYASGAIYAAWRPICPDFGACVGTGFWDRARERAAISSSDYRASPMRETSSMRSGYAKLSNRSHNLLKTPAYAQLRLDQVSLERSEIRHVAGVRQ
jgi:hypothetical protein